MRKRNFFIAFSIVIFCITNVMIGQTTVQQVIKNEIVDLLVRGNVLNSAERNKELAEKTGRLNTRIAQKEIKDDQGIRNRILDNYHYPHDGKNKLINPDQEFKGVNLSYIGS
jgi:hypothetical protein